MKPYSSKFRGSPKYIAHMARGIPQRARGLTKSAKLQIINANRSRHKSERQLAKLRIKKELMDEPEKTLSDVI